MTLRRFLNALAAAELPFAVCAVEVEPAAGERPAAPESGVLVADNLSRFVVTIELIQPVVEDGGPGA